MFLTNKFKEMNQHDILETILSAMIGNIKIKNILDVNEISKSMKPNKCTHQKNYENIKVQWVQKNQGVMFLVVPPKDVFALKCLIFKVI
jgi:hypothetical protein